MTSERTLRHAAIQLAVCVNCTQCVTWLQTDDVDDKLSAHSFALNTSVSSRPTSTLSVLSPFLFGSKPTTILFVILQSMSSFRNTVKCSENLGCKNVFIHGTFFAFYVFYFYKNVYFKNSLELAARLRGSRPGGAIRIIDDVITWKL